MKMTKTQTWLPLLATLSAPQIMQAENTEKPNIVFLLIDDLGWGELGPYGNTFNETPNIDRMSREGVTFTNAYAASAVSSPTRASFYTGQYTPRHGICDYLPERTENFLDPAKHVTINEALKNAGYYTGMIGKWHLDTEFKENPGGPDKHGYDWVFGTETKYIAGGDYFYPYDKISTITTGQENEFLTDRLCNEALSFIESNKDRPFFLSVQLYSVHMTAEAPAELVTKYKQKYEAKYGAGTSDRFETSTPKHGGKPDNPYLAGMIERIDANVGNIMQKIKDLGLDEKTIFIVTSDNGGDIPVGNNGGLKQCKTWIYEGGIRVPLIIRYPGVCDEGTRCDVPVNTIDFYPTFLKLAGNATTTQQLDGEDISPLFKKGGALQRDELYWYYPAGSADWNPRKGCAIRKGDYKLIYRFALSPDTYELYNLADDPNETHNLVAENPEKFRELKERLDLWMEEMNLPKWSEEFSFELFDFESGFPEKWGTNGNPVNNPDNEDHTNFSIAANPAPEGINTSEKTGHFIRKQNGLWWAYAWFDFPDVYLPASDEKPLYLHVMVRKPLKSTVCVQVVGENNASTYEMQRRNSKVNEWEDLVFEITQPNYYNSIQLKADFENAPNRLTDDLDIYFDNIIINTDPTPRGGSAVAEEWLISDFEKGFSAGFGTNGNNGTNVPEPNSPHFSIVDNPLPDGLNPSAKVGKFTRLKSGLWWANAWFVFDTIEVNTSPTYLHVMVNKPIKSTVCVQMKDAMNKPTYNTGEIKSEAYTRTGQWQDLVFKVQKTGDFCHFEFKPDFIQTPPPADRLTDNLDIYFDNIVLNYDPNPRTSNVPTETPLSTDEDLLEVFPTVTAGWTEIQNRTRENMEARLYVPTGTLTCRTLLAPGINTLDLSKQPAGTYILKAGNAQHSITTKIVKK